MKRNFIVANFKSNKTLGEGKKWLEELSIILKPQDSKEIIVCPSFTLLPLFKQIIDQQKLPLKLGAQNISPFGSGSYTGEISGEQIKELADFVIIGHSERLSNFSESKEMIDNKVNMSLQSDLIPIFCVQDKDAEIPAGVSVVAYEPVFAIGTGQADTPENANDVARVIKSKGVTYILYGGSVTSENVKSFIDKENINGVLVGGASLEANEFFEIIKNA